MTTNKLTGREAFEYALVTGVVLRKHADPTEGAREYDLSCGSDRGEAQEVLRQDASLLWVELRQAGAAVHAVLGRLGLVVHLVADCWDDTGLVSSDWLPVADARRAEEALRAAGVVASLAPDWNDPAMAWLYVSLQEDKS